MNEFVSEVFSPPTINVFLQMCEYSAKAAAAAAAAAATTTTTIQLWGCNYVQIYSLYLYGASVIHVHHYRIDAIACSWHLFFFM
jgi:hypothetical protein